MKNIKEVAETISEEKEGIVLFADGDLDGVSSAIMLKKSIEAIGGSAVVYLSNREKWGHGLTPKAVSAIEEENTLLVTLDCGISNFEGVEEANKRGFRVIIVDHHEPLEKLPDAQLIIDPKQKDDDYPFKKMANAGVVLFLVKELLKEKFLPLKRSFLEITTLATVADMVPKEEDNKKILEEGIPLLQDPQIPALRVLKRKVEEDFIQKAVSLLNITQVSEKVNQCFLFLSATEEKTAEDMLDSLFQARKKRDKKISSAVEKIIEKVSDDSVIVFEEGEFPFQLSGSVASHVKNKIKKPTFVYVTEDDVSRGSVRVTSGVNAVKAMSSCSEHLLSFGGHPPAAGFALKNSNLDKFKNCLIEYFK